MASENIPKAAPQTWTRLAVIDLDGTLLKGLNAERIFYSDLVIRGRVGALRMAGFLLSLVRDSVRLGFRKAIGSNARLLRGQTPETVRRWAQAFGRTYLRRAVPEPLRAKILSLKAGGCRVVLLTGSLRIIAEQLEDRLGAEIVIGTELEVEGGRLTGRKTGIFAYGPRKLDALYQRIDPEGTDWGGSWALADRFSDLPVLERVGHPVVVHADRRLRRLARKRGWEVVGRR
jgi:phosphoserine phosphatase